MLPKNQEYIEVRRYEFIQSSNDKNSGVLLREQMSPVRTQHGKESPIRKAEPQGKARVFL